ncbi:MAG: hypothetical protein ACYYK0_02380 [Candidatus Eutrophobiaceae bacterium]
MISINLDDSCNANGFHGGRVGAGAGFDVRISHFGEKLGDSRVRGGAAGGKALEEPEVGVSMPPEPQHY